MGLILKCSPMSENTRHFRSCKKNATLKVPFQEVLWYLDQVVEATETVRVSRLVDVHQTANLAGREADVLVTDHDLQLLATHAVWLRPEGVVLSHDLGSERERQSG